MRICWFGIYKHDYSRNNILLTGLRAKNIELIECQVPHTDKFKYLKLYKKLIKLNNQYDYIYAAYPSPSIVPIAKIFSKRKIIVDAFYSMYDAAVIDRELLSRYSLKGYKLWLLDWLSVLLADIIITDTESHANYWLKWPLIKRLKKDKIKCLPLGVNNNLIYPIHPDSPKNKALLVHFHGTYIPLQGVDIIIEAIKIVKNTPANIKWRLVGTGQTFAHTKELIDIYNLNDSIELIESVSYTKLNQLINEADIVLGIFGNTTKADRVIPNKVYEGLAAKKIVITKNTPAIKEAFDDSEIISIQNTPTALAETILQIYHAPDKFDSIKEAGYKKIINNFTPTKIAEKLLSIIEPGA